MKTALVTGATGFIGGHVVRALRSAGWRVRALVRPTSQTAALESLGVDRVVGDVGDPASLDAAVVGCDAVFHLASLLKVPWKPAFHTVNVEGARNVAAACAATHPSPILVLMSSMAAAGPAPGAPRREGDPPAPVSIYGRVKRAAELVAIAFADRIPLSIVRPPMVFGPGDRGTLPLFRSAAKGLHVVPTLRPARVSMIHATDLATAMVAIAERGARVPTPTPPDGAGVYHVAHPGVGPAFDDFGRQLGVALGRRVHPVRLPGPLTWAVACVAELWARLRDRPAPLNRDKVREARAGDWLCDTGKVERELGFEAAAPIEARLAETVRWYRDEGWLP